MTCKEHIVSSDYLISESKLNVSKCKFCRKIYDKKRNERLKRFDTNLTRLKSYNPSLANKENLLLLYEYNGIDIDNLLSYKFIRVFPPRDIKNDIDNLHMYQVIYY